MDNYIKLYNKMISSLKKDILKSKNNVVFEKVKEISSFQYLYNINYTDDILEDALDFLASSYCKVSSSGNKIVFFDSFGFEFRGLINQYIDCLLDNHDLIYITYEYNKTRMGKLAQKLNNYNAQIVYIRNDLSAINLLSKYFNQCNNYIIYPGPNDVISLVMARLFVGRKYLINLTDHAFWLGNRNIDYYINFRNYGSNINFYFRGISKEKMLLLPYYPYGKFSNDFNGFPCQNMNRNNTIFSGGALYKTIDSNLTYYKIIEELLSDSDFYFWYAGFGNNKYLKILMKKFPGRVFFTSERKDLLGILKNVRLYISTYPMIGGLMSQYCVLANIPALTLLFDECSSGILLRSGQDAFEYESKDLLIMEAKKLMCDDNYYYERIKKWKDNLITKDIFDYNLENILLYQHSDFDVIIEEKLNTSKFLANIRPKSILDLVAFFYKKHNYHSFKIFIFKKIAFFIKIIKKIKRG